MPRPSTNDYFVTEQEEAVVEFILNYDNIPVRNRIFKEKLYHSLKRLVHEIVKRYNTHVPEYGLEELESMAFADLYEQIPKFCKFIVRYKKNNDDKWINDKKGKFMYYEQAEIYKNNLEKSLPPDYIVEIAQYKAYSYFGTICKHYIRHRCEESYLHETSKSEITPSVDDELDTFEFIEEEVDFGFRRVNIFEKTIKALKKEVENKQDLTPLDIYICYALISFLESYKGAYTKENDEYTVSYLRNKLYEYITEITGAKPKDIKNCFSKFYSTLSSLIY